MSRRPHKPAQIGFKIGFASKGYVMPAVAPALDEPHEEHAVRVGHGNYITKQGDSFHVAKKFGVRAQKFRQVKGGKFDKIVSAVVEQQKRQAEELASERRQNGRLREELAAVQAAEALNPFAWDGDAVDALHAETLREPNVDAETLALFMQTPSWAR